MSHPIGPGRRQVRSYRRRDRGGVTGGARTSSFDRFAARYFYELKPTVVNYGSSNQHVYKPGGQQRDEQVTKCGRDRGRGHRWLRGLGHDYYWDLDIPP